MTRDHRPPGPLGTSSSGGGGRQPGPLGLDPRSRAKVLKAADARELLQTSLPVVLEHLTVKQVQQMQRVLDAAVVDPEVRKEAQAFYDRSKVTSGSLTVQDQAMVHRGDRAMESYIMVAEADKRIRLDFKALLAPDALKPTTDNSDEAAYLEKVRQTLTTRGVWLRFAPKLVRDVEDPSRHVLDPRAIEVWISLGPDGDTIPTKDGRLTRDALLGTTLFGAGYYRSVDYGAVQAALNREINRLRIDIESGLEQHQQLAKIRRDAFVGVSEASDLFGGADFPDQSIWDGPHRFVLRAMELNVGGNVKASQAYLVTAAILTRNAAGLLADYIDDSSSGVERVVAVAKVLKTAGEVAQVGLAVTDVVGIARGGAALAEKLTERQAVSRWAAENPEFAAELKTVEWVPQPKGSVAGGVKPGTSSGAGSGVLPYWRGRR